MKSIVIAAAFALTASAQTFVGQDPAAWAWFVNADGTYSRLSQSNCPYPWCVDPTWVEYCGSADVCNETSWVWFIDANGNWFWNTSDYCPIPNCIDPNATDYCGT